MTEYKIECTSGVGDTITACLQGEEIEVVARSMGSFTQSVYPSLATARTFARGILALADEVDGGEAREEPVKVGDFVEITGDDVSSYVGRRGYLRKIDGSDPDLPYLLKGNNGAGLYDWWARAVRKVDAPEPAPVVVEEPSVRGIKAGDKVRILVNHAESADVTPGDVFPVGRVSGETIVVDFEENGVTWHWYFRDPESVEKVVDEPPANWEREILKEGPSPSTATVTRPTREALLHRAADLLAGSSTYTAFDLIALADDLAEEK
ncbi:hypothetical protein [Streptomyces sp. NBC_01212]|uniref:hypothetical protein n=1 Tax=Streptomyces sp. NBC_01212 TaxID=2903775 RepID=UPI002E116DCB|nr:hypothetical protein OG722_04930 [Streptomyces sp. NBC_01212]